MLPGIQAWSAFSCRCLSAFLSENMYSSTKTKNEKEDDLVELFCQTGKKSFILVKIMKQPFRHTIDLYLQIQNRNGGQLLVVSYFHSIPLFCQCFILYPKRAFHSVNGNHTRIREKKVVLSLSF